MSDSESDPNLIQEVYDPEDDLNVYGSPVVHRAAARVEQPSISSTQVPLSERTQVSLQPREIPHTMYGLSFLSLLMFHSAFIVLSMQEYLQ